jgi:hypothetical protein
LKVGVIAPLKPRIGADGRELLTGPRRKSLPAVAAVFGATDRKVKGNRRTAAPRRPFRRIGARRVDVHPQRDGERQVEG